MKKVSKFGGSSLASAKQFKKVGDIIRADKSRRYVVPSAPGKRNDKDEKVTDMLYACYDAASEGRSYKKILEKIRGRYEEIIEGLDLNLNLENGKKVVIKANNNGEANRYISSMKVNGKNYTKNYLIHGDLMRGMNILYNMSATPNKSRGTQDSDAPYSFSNELGK